MRRIDLGDDHSRLVYAEVLSNLDSACATAFLRRATAWFAERGVRIQALMSDNGSCYISHAYAAALHELKIKHLRIRPGRPRTNGKAERLIQTLLREWAYAAAYPTSAARRRALPAYLNRYNTKRPHKALGGIPPSQRLAERTNPAAADT